MTAPDRLAHLQRLLAAERDNEKALIDFFVERARVDGSAVYLDILKDRELWNSCPNVLQDSALREVSLSLSPNYDFVGAERYECASLSHRIGRYRHRKLGVELHLIPGGRYMMGTQDLDKEVEHTSKLYKRFEEWVAWEVPAHWVSVDPFLIGRFLLTQQQYSRITANPSFFNKDPLNPVDSVSWLDCKKWLAEAGGALRLPSEAEWEYACRAGAKTRFFWGDQFDDRYAWHKGNCDNETKAVTLHAKDTNAFGLVDILGSLWEWCEDNWIDNYNNGPYTQAARTAEGPDRRVYRGGCWLAEESYSRITHRTYRTADDSGSHIGLRLARSLVLELERAS